MEKSIADIAFYLRLLWQKNKSYFWGFALLVLAAAGSPLIAAVLPKVMLHDLLTNTPQKFFVDFAGLALLSCLCSLISAYYSVKDSDIFVGIGFRLKEPIQERAMAMPFAWTENPAMLTKINGAMAAVDRFVGAIHNSGVGILSNGLVLTAYCWIVVSFQPMLLLLFACNIAVSLMIQNRAKKYQYGRKAESITLGRKKDYVFGLMYDYGYGKEIRLYGIQGWLVSIYTYYKAQCRRLNRQIQSRHFTAAIADLLFTLAREAVVYVYLISLFAAGRLTVDNFILYTGIAASFAAVGLAFSGAVTDFADAVRNIEEYRQFLEEKDTDGEADGTLPAKSTYAVRFQDVSFRYPDSDIYALRHFSYQIEAGKHIAIVGLNGAGKSTLIKLLCGLYNQYEGLITVDDVDIRTLRPSERSRIFAAVFQESKVLSATVLENITLSEQNTPEMKEKAAAALKRIGLYERMMALPQQLETPVTRVLEDNGVEFSGGERQKLVMARALYKNGNILILDEPTAALDPLAENALYENFHTISEGKTTLFISHRLNSTRFCDDILLLKDGQVLEHGPHDVLYERKGAYYRLFRLQAERYADDTDASAGKEAAYEA